MKTELSISKSAIGIASESYATKSRTWVSGDRTSRTDAPMVSALTEDAIDAAFGEESFAFESETSESAAMVQGLSSQLAMLESQCEQLRRILNTVSVNR